MITIITIRIKQYVSHSSERLLVEGIKITMPGSYICTTFIIFVQKVYVYLHIYYIISVYADVETELTAR